MKTDFELWQYIDNNIELFKLTPFTYKAIHHDKEHGTKQTIQVNAQNDIQARAEILKRFKQYLKTKPSV